MVFGPWCLTGVFERSRKVFMFFSRLKPSNCFPVKTHVFETYFGSKSVS